MRKGQCHRERMYSLRNQSVRDHKCPKMASQFGAIERIRMRWMGKTQGIGIPPNNDSTIDFWPNTLTSSMIGGAGDSTRSSKRWQNLSRPETQISAAVTIRRWRRGSAHSRKSSKTWANMLTGLEILMAIMRTPMKEIILKTPTLMSRTTTSHFPS